jgi:hypothetical protein
MMTALWWLSGFAGGILATFSICWLVLRALVSRWEHREHGQPASPRTEDEVSRWN